jgi:hypothetical protein
MGDPKAPKVRRRLVEGQCCIDVSALYNARKLGPGSCCTWSWSRGTSIVGAVNLAVNADAIDIDGYVATGTGIVPVQEVIQIARLPARFANRPCGRGRGAVTTFLLCPGYGSRRRKLYIVTARCRCRGCHRLGFALETKSADGRERSTQLSSAQRRLGQRADRCFVHVRALRRC